MRRLGLISCVAAGLLAACETVPPPPPPPIYGPPPPPPDMTSAAAPDWRAVILPADRSRYDRRALAWDQGLSRAMSEGGATRLSSLGDLVEPGAARANVTPLAGDYDCRTVRLGPPDGGGRGLSIHNWFSCRIESTPAGLKFVKLGGTHRPAGLLFDEDGQQMVMLGSMAMENEPTPSSYGLTPDRDLVAVLERVGPARWRLAFPWPVSGSVIELIELVPAS